MESLLKSCNISDSFTSMGNLNKNYFFLAMLLLKIIGVAQYIWLSEVLQFTYFSVKLGTVIACCQIKVLCVYLNRTIQILAKEKLGSTCGEILAFTFRFWMSIQVGWAKETVNPFLPFTIFVLILFLKINEKSQLRAHLCQWMAMDCHFEQILNFSASPAAFGAVCPTARLAYEAPSFYCWQKPRV